MLQAILSQAAIKLSGSSIISTAQQQGIVTALTNLTAAQPMLNKAELVTRLAADPSVIGLGNKEARECVLRAFSDVVPNPNLELAHRRSCTIWQISPHCYKSRGLCRRR